MSSINEIVVGHRNIDDANRITHGGIGISKHRRYWRENWNCHARFGILVIEVLEAFNGKAGKSVCAVKDCLEALQNGIGLTR